jgi:hypothetical protein
MRTKLVSAVRTLLRAEMGRAGRTEVCRRCYSESWSHPNLKFRRHSAPLHARLPYKGKRDGCALFVMMGVQAMLP